MKTKLEEIRVWNSDNSWNLSHNLTINGRKCRVEIRRNAYDHQSHAIICMFDGDKWNKLHSIPCELMQCLSLSYTDRDKSTAEIYLNKDAYTLITEAEELLNEH